jgi:hypothetical protein
MLIKQFNVKGRTVEMFDFIKRIYVEKLQQEAGYNLNIPNNKIIERLIEEKYKQLTEE